MSHDHKQPLGAWIRFILFFFTIFYYYYFITLIQYYKAICITYNTTHLLTLLTILIPYGLVKECTLSINKQKQKQNKKELKKVKEKAKK